MIHVIIFPNATVVSAIIICSFQQYPFVFVIASLCTKNISGVWELQSNSQGVGWERLSEAAAGDLKQTRQPSCSLLTMQQQQTGVTQGTGCNKASVLTLFISVHGTERGVLILCKINRAKITYQFDGIKRILRQLWYISETTVVTSLTKYHVKGSS